MQLVSHPDIRVKDLQEARSQQSFVNIIEANYKIEGDLRREIAGDIRRKVEIQSYQGIRHRKGLTCSWSAHTYKCAYS
jgi:small subunit ribosomal protein S13